MTSAPHTIRLFRPAPPLRAAVSSYYALRVDGDAGAEDLMPPEWPNMRLAISGRWRIAFATHTSEISAGGATVSGTLSRATLAGGHGLLFGVGLLPEGWLRLTGKPAAIATDTVLPLADLTDAPVGRLMADLIAAADDQARCAVLDAWLPAAMRAAGPEVAGLRSCYAAMVDPGIARVADWAARLGLSPRQLERQARAWFGLSPKLLLRRQRFLRTLAEIRAQPRGQWGRLLDEAYLDQPQFIHDFQHFMGMSPQQYVGRPVTFMVSTANERIRVLGRAYQALHPAFRPPA